MEKKGPESRSFLGTSFLSHSEAWEVGGWGDLKTYTLLWFPLRL